MLDKNFIGHRYDSITVPVELGRLKFFAKAIGETNPIYFDTAAAQESGHKSVLAPPTFMMVIDAEYPVDSMPEIDLLGMDLGRVMHAGQTFEYFEPVYAGDEITADRRISDIYDKKDGALEFVVIDSEYTNQSGRLVSKAQMSIVYRN